MNRFDEMRAAVHEARTTLNAADNVADQMASILRGRLRKVDNCHLLAMLKKELSEFNAHTKEWKS